MALYDRIGIDYDATRRADPYLVQRLVHHLAPTPAGRYLEVGCGTGNYTIEVAKRGARIIAIDQSPTMIAAARKKPAPRIAWNIANAEALPLRDDAVDGAVCFLAHHHFQNVERAFGQVFRALRSGGRFVIFNTAAEQLRGCWLREYFPAMMDQTIEVNHRIDAERCLKGAGFRIAATEVYDIPPDLQDSFLYCGKHDPVRYLDPRVRAGISTFARMAESPEIALGCEKLAADIASGRFDEVARRYDNGFGDYTFWVAAKP